MSAQPPITFNGQSYDTRADFVRDYPAYASDSAIRLIRAGADTPHKVECADYAKRKPAARPGRGQSISIERRAKQARHCAEASRLCDHGAPLSAAERAEFHRQQVEATARLEAAKTAQGALEL